VHHLKQVVCIPRLGVVNKRPCGMWRVVPLLFLLGLETSFEERRRYRNRNGLNRSSDCSNANRAFFFGWRHSHPNLMFTMFRWFSLHKQLSWLQSLDRFLRTRGCDPLTLKYVLGPCCFGRRRCNRGVVCYFSRLIAFRIVVTPGKDCRSRHPAPKGHPLVRHDSKHVRGHLSASK